jgi:pre-mRNA-splicing factor ATP-dependent RNA helicase DHX15/PRP43
MTDNKNIGVLDPLGEFPNPLTDKPYSQEYKNLAAKWSKLPAYLKRDEIMQTIRNNQVTLLISSTGSGKSVCVPRFVLHIFDYNKKIAITLPKQIISKSLAEYTAKLLDVNIGEAVGYQYKGVEKGTKSDKTKLLFATDGTIISRILKDPLLTEYDAIIMDELHERSTNIDYLLFLLRNVVEKRPEFKLVLMSATINDKLFAAYFSGFKFGLIDVGGERHFPITSIFLNEPITKNLYMDKGYEIIQKILKEDDPQSEGSHDIIFFIPSVADALDICRKCTKDKLDLYCIEVYAGIDSNKEELAIDKSKYKQFGKSRKLIMSTNVGESSITFDGLKYVIDSGYEFHGYYDPEIDARVLDKAFITNAQAKQRMGRAGRTEPGICYHLYTKEEFENKMEAFPAPKIAISNIYQECLKLLAYPNVETLEKLIEMLGKFIEPPRELYIRSAIYQLRYLNLVDDTKITKFGEIVNSMQMDPMMAVAVYAARSMKCSNEVLVILTTIEVAKNNLSDIFNVPKYGNDSFNKQMDKYNNAKKKLGSKSGDHLSIYNIINKYSILYKEKNEDKLRDYIQANSLKRKTLDKSYSYYKKYKGTLRDVLKDVKEIEVTKEMPLEDKILGAIACGYKLHFAYLRDKTYSTNKVDKVKLSRNSFLDQKKLPQNIFYNELFSSSGKLELNIASKTSPKIEEIITLVNEVVQQI